MGSNPPSEWVSQATELLRVLVAPAALFLVSVYFLIDDSIIHPPTELQGESGLALVLIAISTGLGMDLLERRRGGGSH